MFYFLYLSRIFLVDVFIFYGGRATPSITASTLHFTQSYHFPCSAQSRMAASFSQICYYQSLFKNKVRVNTMYPLKRLRLADLRGKKPGVFEPQSSRCLAYLNESPPPLTNPPAYHPQDSMWIGAGSFVSAFILAPHKVRAAERAHAGISKGAGRHPTPSPPTPQWDNAGRRISHRPSHPWLYTEQTALGVAWLGVRQQLCCLNVCVSEVFC